MNEVAVPVLTVPKRPFRRRATRKPAPCAICRKTVSTRDAVALNGILCHRKCAEDYIGQAEQQNAMIRAGRLRSMGLEIANPRDVWVDPPWNI